MRALVAPLFLILAMAGCGSDDSSDGGNEPEPAYPLAAGSYTVSGGFDGLAPSAASFTGTVVVTQASRDAAPLGGNASITATVGGTVFPVTGPMIEASITTAGVMTFVLGGEGVTWSFTGTLAGTTVAGRHTLSDGVDSFSGNWSMTRAAGATQALFAVARVAPADIVAALRALH